MLNTLTKFCYLLRRHIKTFMLIWTAGPKVLGIRHHCNGSSFLSPSAGGQVCAALPHTSLCPPQQHGTLLLFWQPTHNNSPPFVPPTHPEKGLPPVTGRHSRGQPTLNPIFLSPCSHRTSSGMWKTASGGKCSYFERVSLFSVVYICFLFKQLNTSQVNNL